MNSLGNIPIGLLPAPRRSVVVGLDSTAQDLTISKPLWTFFLLGRLLGRASGCRLCMLGLLRSAVVGPGYGLACCPCRCRKKGEALVLVPLLPTLCICTLYYPDAIYLPNSRSLSHRPPSPQKSQRLWLTENGFPEKTLVWLICQRYICSVWEKFPSRQAVLTFWCCIRADDLLRLAATLAHQRAIGRQISGRFVYALLAWIMYNGCVIV